MLQDRATAGLVVAAAFLWIACVLIGCHTRDADESSVRLTRAQVIGLYQTKSDAGLERLELKADGTYAQDFPSQSFHHVGQWRIEKLFLDGSEIVLLNAVLSQSDATHSPSLGELTLYTHKRFGKVILARNEVADWYYESIPK